eukprot:1175825-Prorocentrum_minimum.AAC.2
MLVTNVVNTQESQERAPCATYWFLGLIQVPYEALVYIVGLPKDRKGFNPRVRYSQGKGFRCEHLIPREGVRSGVKGIDRCAPDWTGVGPRGQGD